MYIEICGNSIRIGRVESDEIFLDDGERIFWAYGLMNRNISKKEFFATVSVLRSELSHQLANRIFAGGYFIVLVDRKSGMLNMMRDSMGQKSGYYYFDSLTERLVVATNMHDIAYNVSTDINKFYTDFLLYQQFIPDGYTIYEDVNEVRIGEMLHYIPRGTLQSIERESLPIEYSENDYSEEENIRLLREKILEVHADWAGENNVVYLSGGIDSCVMLASLHNICPEQTRVVSYRIAGSSQDETIYAQELASYLGYNTEVVTVDPADPKIVADYEDDLQKMNNPVFGNWIFRPHLSNDISVRYFAGQDTRLHTPSVNSVDMKVIDRISHQGTGGWGAFGKGVVDLYERLSCLLKLYNAADRRVKYSHLLVNALVPKWFILRRKFMADPVKYKTWRYDMSNFEKICDWYRVDLHAGMSSREIFNRLIEKKWQEQYTDDIRYMVDMAHNRGVTTVLPFYEQRFNQFASTIPWKLANKTMAGLDGFSNKPVRVNKYVLRKAFEKELPWNIMVRAKAVSLSSHLMMNGVLGIRVEQTLRDDLRSSDSFCRRFGYQAKAREIIAHRSKWEMKNSYMVTFANYLSALCVYYRKNVVKK